MVILSPAFRELCNAFMFYINDSNFFKNYNIYLNFSIESYNALQTATPESSGCHSKDFNDGEFNAERRVISMLEKTLTPAGLKRA